MTSPELRFYQTKLDNDITEAWDAGAENICAELPTGGGKTVVMAKRFAEHRGASIGIAHRQELVSQISLALARFGLRHRIIAPKEICQMIARRHHDYIGQSFYDPNAWVGVAGVDTLIRRPPSDPWFHQVTLWQTDECHHVLRGNKWGKACAIFQRAKGIGWTATPGRADGKGIGRKADGLMDVMISGPRMRDLINAGYLTEYRLACPPNDIDMSDVGVGTNGDFNQAKLRKAVHKSSKIVGDIVKKYLEVAPGKRGVTFAVDIEHAEEMAAAYRAAGVRAELVSSETPGPLRDNIIRRLERGDVLQVVNVDIFGEGFDLPAIEVVSMGRPTQSFPLYAQQFGRALRPSEGKTHGIILDHAGNTARHGGPPDKPRAWSLNSRTRGPMLPLDGIPMRDCTHCAAPYERILPCCPYCNQAPEIMDKSRPEFVDGDLLELTPEALQLMRHEVDRIDGAFWAPNGMAAGIYRLKSAQHYERQAMQVSLRDQIHTWAGWKREGGADDRQIYKLFFWKFGTDIMSAMALNAADAALLAAHIMQDLGEAGAFKASPVNP